MIKAHVPSGLAKMKSGEKIVRRRIATTKRSKKVTAAPTIDQTIRIRTTLVECWTCGFKLDRAAIAAGSLSASRDPTQESFTSESRNLRYGIFFTTLVSSPKKFCIITAKNAALGVLLEERKEGADAARL